MKSFREICLPSSDKRRKAGALAPTLSIESPYRIGLNRVGNRKSGSKAVAIQTILRKQLANYFVDGLRVGLAARGTHDLADKEFEDAFVAGFEFGDVVRIFRNDFAGGLLDGGVADLRAEAFGSRNLRWTASSPKHLC